MVLIIRDQLCTCAHSSATLEHVEIYGLTALCAVMIANNYRTVKWTGYVTTFLLYQYITGHLRRAVHSAHIIIPLFYDGDDIHAPSTQGFIPPFLLGVEYETVRGTIKWPSGGGVWRGVSPSPGMEVQGYHPGKILKFEAQFGAIWCILARN